MQRRMAHGSRCALSAVAILTVSRNKQQHILLFHIVRVHGTCELEAKTWPQTRAL